MPKRITEAGQKQIKTSLDYYRENAKTITAGLDKIGKKYVGGKHSPISGCDMPSWEYFDMLLTKQMSSELRERDSARMVKVGSDLPHSAMQMRQRKQ